MDPYTAEFSPESIRELRGGRSRAAFAQVVGVTAQTVYRWELPSSAKEARRPRGQQLKRLAELAAGAGAAPTASAASRAFATHEAESPASWVDDDVSRVLPALERVLRGDLRRGHNELVQAVTSSQALSPNARAAAYFGIALCDLLDRCDARAALLVIAPLLDDAEAGRLSPAVAAKLFSVAALCHAFPDVWLFDLGRVHAYQARVETMPGQTDHDASCIACVAALCAATYVGDAELVERAFAKLDEVRWSALPLLLELHVDEFRSIRALYTGKSAACIQSSEAAAHRAEQCGYTLVQARSLTRVALCQLDVLADPELVLGTVRSAKALTHGGRMRAGIHQLLALRVEIEALVRLGRIEEALMVSSEVDAWSVETGLPALAAASAQTRLFHLANRPDAHTSLAQRLRSCELPSLRPICEAYASHAEACSLLTTHSDPALAVALFEQAERQAGRWPFLLREVLLYRVYAHAAAGEEAPGRIALRRAQRCVDEFPSPWFSAHLRRLEGGLLAARGHWVEGAQLMQSSAATFDLAKDKCDAALTRYLYCLIADAFDEPNASQALTEARERLAELSVPEPRSMTMGVARFKSQRPTAHNELAADRSRGVERLVVPFQRVAMRGVAPSLILSELRTVTSALFTGRMVDIEEIDSAGTARSLFGAAKQEARDMDWIEFSDGAGRSLRLGIQGRLEHAERAALHLLVMTASLALEVAVLRGVGERAHPRGSEFPPVELPGFIAASVEMRKLRSELARLASSRSTVIITGESGAGKDIVARAIHDLSERSSQAYVAFNCATVPRELFEGQLFGYRRGAFTGASADHVGVIRAANRGTLFLDEIAELPLDIQPKLLRFLENAEVLPLGERAPVRVDVRVLAATHRDLAALVREGRFREDLYYRLQVVPVFVPPLRDRRADIPVLARHFLRELTRRGEPAVLGPDALAVLAEQRFPGNVRELRNILERAVAYFPDEELLRAEHLRLTPPSPRTSSHADLRPRNALQ